VKIVLWTLSNLVLSDSRARVYFSDEQLALRTLSLMRSKSFEIATEAAYVVTNVLTTTKD
jgi:hypothetical protein